MTTGVELVSGLIIHYMTFEDVYLGQLSALTDQLKEALCNLYAAVLVYLSKARRYFTHRTSSKQLLITLLLIVSNLFLKFVSQEVLSTQWITVLMHT